jgi:predicted metal-dependent hydrolase
MNNPAYKYIPKDVSEIVNRDFAFDFPADLDPVWIPGNRVRSHFFNGLSLTMPYLEPFLMRTISKAKKEITDKELLADMTGFNQQEGNHYKCHIRFNDILKANGYPEFEAHEKRMFESYARLSKRSLRSQLAYTAGFESMTNGFTTWLITKRAALFGGASSHVTSFWIMHMVEETEHKTVAYDAYMAYSGEYWPRVIGVFRGSFHLVGLGIIGMLIALKKDKVLYRPGTILKVLGQLLSFSVNVGPFLIRALLPGFNPRDEKDPQWMKDWVKGYKTLPDGELIPLLDTRNPAMPVPF